MRSIMKIGVVATLALGATCSSAFADTTYVYTGTDFTFDISPYTASEMVTGSITLSAPLADNLPLSFVLPVAFSFSDGVQTLSYANTNSDTFVVSTNARGDITNWYISVAAVVSGIPLELIETSALIGDYGLSAIAVPGSFVGAYTASPGMWSPVPEASTWAMMAVGFVGLGVLGLRKRKAHPRVVTALQ
jgi:hypothetical protein